MTATGVTTSEGLRDGVRAQASLSSLATRDFTAARSRIEPSSLCFAFVVLPFVE